MKKICDFEEGFLPNFDDLYLLWENNRWDGPMEGICLYNEKLCLFECCDETYNSETIKDEEGENYVLLNRKRLFAVKELSEDEARHEKERHDLFMEKVGEHTDYIDGKTRKNAACRPYESCMEFYDKYPPSSRPKYTANKVLAYFLESDG